LGRMTDLRDDFLALARVATQLLHEPAVASAWDTPSALEKFSVHGLAGHLAFQILAVPVALAEPIRDESVVPLLGHYERVKWIGADLDDEINVFLRQDGERVAAEGPMALAARVDAVTGDLAGELSSAKQRPVRLSFWGPYTLSLEDFLVTRMLELAVHIDDLAVSVGLPTPQLPQRSVQIVVDVLSQLALRRHGPVALLRALSRAERAPATIAAF
jgi:mycothiol maleylpyruvate isomerase-like protein